MASGLLGYWPGEWSSSRSNPTNMAEHSQRDPGLGSLCSNIGDMRQRPASSHKTKRYSSDDESYYDAPSNPQDYLAPKTGGPRKSYKTPLPSPTVVANISGLSDSDWQTFQPPVELLYAPPGTSMELDSILEASIERLQDRLVEEDRLRLQDETINSRAECKVKGKESIILGGGNDKRANQVTSSQSVVNIENKQLGKKTTNLS